MNRTRILTVLVAATLMMQGVILYRDYSSHRPANTTTKNRRWPAEPNTVFDLAGIPTRGNEKARVALVIFSDFECPFCTRHATDGVQKEVDEKFVDTGKIKVAFAHNPLPMHKQAEFLATASFCAQKQNRFWEMHDRIFIDRAQTEEAVLSIANGLALKMPTYRACLTDKQEASKQITSDMEEAERFGLTGTPSFAVGRMDSEGRQVTIDTFIPGAAPFSVFEEVLTKVLG